MSRRSDFVLLVQTGVLVESWDVYGWKKKVQTVARAQLIDESFIPVDVEDSALWFLKFAAHRLDGTTFQRSIELAGVEGGRWYAEWLEWREVSGYPPLPW